MLQNNDQLQNISILFQDSILGIEQLFSSLLILSKIIFFVDSGRQLLVYNFVLG